jgi:DNA-directed RNA polymerase omega subunit
VRQLMSEEIKTAGDVAGGGQWPGIDSRFRLVVVAARRSKQLVRGALPKIAADPRRRRNTTIALEEVRQGLVPFTDGRNPQGDGVDEGGGGD